MKYSRKMQRLLEVKIVRSIKAETGKLPYIGYRPNRPESPSSESDTSK